MIPDEIKQKIDSGDYTFIDKVINGGFGYGKVCIPDELPQVILAVIFPPLSIIWNWYVGLYPIWKTIYKFIVCLLLTMFFYIPGLIYAINDLACRARVKVNEAEYIQLTGEKYSPISQI